MRYSYDFKKQCVDLYRQGLWPETPEGIKQRNFRSMIGRWARIEDVKGPEALRHKNSNKVWSAEEKLELVLQVIAGNSIQQVAISAGINSGMLYTWVRKYKTMGYNGLVGMKKGRLPKEHQMKKKAISTPIITTSKLVVCSGPGRAYYLLALSKRALKV